MSYGHEDQHHLAEFSARRPEEAFAMPFGPFVVPLLGAARPSPRSQPMRQSTRWRLTPPPEDTLGTPA